MTSIKKFEEFINETFSNYNYGNIIEKIKEFSDIVKAKQFDVEDVWKQYKKKGGIVITEILIGYVEDTTVQLRVRDGKVHQDSNNVTRTSPIRNFEGRLDGIYLKTYPNGDEKVFLEFYESDGEFGEDLYSANLEDVINLEDFERYLDNYIANN